MTLLLRLALAKAIALLERRKVEPLRHSGARPRLTVVQGWKE